MLSTICLVISIICFLGMYGMGRFMADEGEGGCANLIAYCGLGLSIIPEYLLFGPEWLWGWWSIIIVTAEVFILGPLMGVIMAAITGGNIFISFLLGVISLIIGYWQQPKQEETKITEEIGIYDQPTQAVTNILRKEIEDLNSKCPFTIGYMEVTGAEYSDGCATITAAVDENYMNLDAMDEADMGLMKRGWIQQMTLSGDDKTKAIYKEIATEGGTIKYKFKGKQSGKSVTMTVTSSDLKDIEHPEKYSPDPESVLQMEIKTINALMPNQLQKGVTAESLILKGNYIISTTVIDEDLFSIDDYKNNPQAKEGIRRHIIDRTGMDNESKKFVDLIKKAGKGIVYKIVGDKSREEYIVTIEPHEL